jgi:multisubunit Na+/H+ antiporter MnhB subunit
MIDNYAIFSIVIPTVALIPFIIVLKKQYREIKRDNKLQWLKRLLLALVIIILAGDLIAILLNFFREPDGNLSAVVRKFSLIYNAVAFLSMAVVLNLIYSKRSAK